MLFEYLVTVLIISNNYITYGPNITFHYSYIVNGTK